jgi:oligosaccharide repeat unit polymerase
MEELLTYVWIFNTLMVMVFNLSIWRDMKNPAVFHSIMWFVIIVLHKFLPHGLYPLESDVLSVVFFSVLVFSAGVMLGQFLTRNLTLASSTSEILPEKHIVTLYVVISIVCLPLLIKSAIALASQGYTTNFFINLRWALSNEDSPQSFGVLSYVMSVAFSALFLKLIDTRKPLKSFGVAITTVICLCYAVLNTGRSFFFQFLVPSFFIVMFARPSALKFKQILLFFGMLIGVFAAMGQLLGKIGGEDKGFINEFGLYLLGGTSAFQEILSEPQHLEYGANSFRTIHAILASMGFNVDVTNLVQSFVNIPQRTNVYTVFQPYFLDFGIPYVLVAQFIFGLMHSCLYSVAVRKHTIGVLLYSLSMYPLFMQWFQDQYLSLLSLWVQYLILLLIPIGVPNLYNFLKELTAKREDSGVA